MRRSAVLLAGLLTGCSGVGPPSVPRDRVDYISAISDSWKQQMLLNLLKVRYADVPVFLDVTSIINAYTLDQDLRGTAQLAPVNRAGDSFGAITGGIRYSEHPTITYVPLTGDKFTKSMMAPIPVSAILLLVQSGYPADVVLRFSVNTINGVQNSHGGYAQRAGDPAFAELLSLIRGEQAAGGLGFEARTDGNRHRTILLLRPPADAATAVRHQRIRELLGLKPDKASYEVGYGSFASGDVELAVLSRSMLQVMLDVASYIDTPPQDTAEGRALERALPAEPRLPAPVRVRESADRPADAFVAVRYRDRWFWIDDRDHPSKAAFSFLMMMFSLTETSSTQAPLLTVPAR